MIFQVRKIVNSLLISIRRDTKHKIQNTIENKITQNKREINK